MFSLKTSQMLLLALGVLLCRDAGAQDFRIYTRVYDAGAAQNVRPTVIGSSLSLFHAGKVYDHVESENESEVIIFEPAHRRFTILSTSRSLATTVHFDEIKRKLKLARNITNKRLEDLLSQKPAPAAETVEKVRFPIEPVFKSQYDAQARLLTCESEHLTYHVRCVEVEDPQTAEFYLHYADWMARLNYVLHPHALYPQPRLKLNELLREHKKMPVEVELRSDIGMPIHLRAEHQFHWKLDATDRSLIHEWESMLKSDTTRQVTFQEYQRSLLISGKD